MIIVQNGWRKSIAQWHLYSSRRIYFTQLEIRYFNSNFFLSKVCFSDIWTKYQKRSAKLYSKTCSERQRALQCSAVVYHPVSRPRIFRVRVSWPWLWLQRCYSKWVLMEGELIRITTTNELVRVGWQVLMSWYRWIVALFGLAPLFTPRSHDLGCLGLGSHDLGCGYSGVIVNGFWRGVSWSVSQLLMSWCG